jgi:MFS family permease
MTSRPTRIRYLIVLVAMLAAVLLYLERVCLSVAEVYIREDLHLDKERMGWVFGAFFFAYALAQVPAGWLSQRYGPRNMMALYMLGWSVFGCFIAVAQNFWMLFLARFLLGLSQAGAYPTAAIIVKRWVPDRQRGIANSIVAFGGRFGGAGATWVTGLLIVAFVPMSTDATLKKADILDLTEIVPPKKVVLNENIDEDLQYLRMRIFPYYREDAPLDSLNEWLKTTWISHQSSITSRLASDGRAIASVPAGERTAEQNIRLNRLLLEIAYPGAIRQLHTDGWRPTLMLYGVLGIVVGALFYILARNWPREHPWVNAAEREFIEQGQTAVSNSTGGSAVPWGLLIRSRNQWFYSSNQFFSNMGWIFLITLMPRFLFDRFKVPVEERGLMATIPLFVAGFAMFFGGWATDRLSRRMGKRWGRAIPLGLGKLPCALAMLACVYMPTAWAAVIVLTIMAASGDFGIPAIWAFAQDTGGKQVGAVLGWGNMWGNFGAGLANLTMGKIEKELGWDYVLVSCAVFFTLSAIAGMMTNAEKPLFEEGKANLAS